jgi:tetratricopeptide (TPR) repeat protein
MFELKHLSREGIEVALRKAERYRLLNEPWEAESICLDVLELEPDNHDALVSLILAITDQFKTEGLARAREAKRLVAGLPGKYAVAYYTGIIWERKGTALIRRRALGHGPVAYSHLRKAMKWYEKAEAIRPPGDDSAIVRWNSCARVIMRHDAVRPGAEDDSILLLE